MALSKLWRLRGKEKWHGENQTQRNLLYPNKGIQQRCKWKEVTLYK